MSIKSFLDSRPRLKKVVHWLLIPANEARPRWWVGIFLNPFLHKRGKGTVIRRRVRMDVMPFNDFSVGAGSLIEDFSVVNNGVGGVYIGNRVVVGMGNVLIGPLSIGNNVIMAQHVVVSGLNHAYEDVNQPIADQKCKTSLITIEDDCWIGANAVITAGVTIGKHAVVAGGSVVTKNVESFTVVGGNPSRVLKKYDSETMEWKRI